MIDRVVDVAREGARQVLRHPLRSVLTAATSAVAIAVTVNVISLVYGLDEDLRRDAGRFGRQTVDVNRTPVIVPGLERRPLGETERGAVVERLKDLEVTIVPRRLATGRAGVDVAEERVSLVAVPSTYPLTLSVALAAGRWLEAADDADAACVLDESLIARFFPGSRPADVLGRELCVAGPAGESRRRIVGVLADPLTHRQVFESFDEGRGARTLTSALLSFRNVYVPLDALGTGEYAGLSVAVAHAKDVDEVARRLREIWTPPRGVDPLFALQSVGVFVRRDWMDLIGATSQTGAFLGNIVWVIVVGVAVVMLTTLNLLTIRERYDELAVRRVEGARREDVAWQITVEGTITALAGGLAGLPIGFAGAAVLREIVDFPFRFEVRYAVAATGVAVLLGLLASVWPARRAAGLQPARVLSRRIT